MTAAPRSEPVTTTLKPSLPEWLKSVLDHCLDSPVDHGRDSQGPLFAVLLWNVHTSNGSGSPGLEGGQVVHQPSPSGGGLDDHLVHARRVLSCVDLRNPPYGHEDVRVAAQHELLERADPTQVVRLCCPEDAVSQVANEPVGSAPVDGVPVGACPSLWSVCKPGGVPLTFPLVCYLDTVLRVTHPIHVGGLSARALQPVSAELWIPRAFRLAAFASWIFLCPPWSSALLAVGLPAGAGHDGVTTFRTSQDANGMGAFATPGSRCPRLKTWRFFSPRCRRRRLRS